MYFADLTPLMYHGDPWNTDCWHVPLLAVGWLEREQLATHGDSPDQLLPRLRQHIEGASDAQPHINFRGLHICTLCVQAEESLKDSHVNLLIPGDGKVYAAPAGIVHYIESHKYLPPAEFTEAVLRCPKYGSFEFYERLLAANLGHPIPLQPWEEYLAERLHKAQEARADNGAHSEPCCDRDNQISGGA